MGQKNSKSLSKTKEQQSEFAIYLLANDNEKTFAQAHLEVAAHGNNAILLFPDPSEMGASSSGSRQYKASFIRAGHWVSEVDNIDKRREVSIGNRHFSNARLSTLPGNQNIKIMSSKSPDYPTILNEILALGGMQLPQFEKKLPDVIHKNVIPPLLDMKSLVALERSSRTLHGFYKPDKIKRHIKKLLQHAIYATPDDIQEIEKILNIPLSQNPPNLKYLRELLFTPATVKRYDGRTIENRTLYQIALAAREYNVPSENGVQVVDGLIEKLQSQYVDKLPDGDTLRKQQYAAQFPEGFEAAEQERIKNDSGELNQTIAVVRDASDDDCQQTMALDSFHGYDLRPAEWASDDNEVLASAIYLQDTGRELTCRFRGLDGQVKIKTISWNELKEFPHSVEDILKDRNKYLPNILEQLAKPGQFYTAKQIEELKALSYAVVTSRSPDEFDKTWNALQTLLKKIAGEFITIHFTVLERLYQFRNYLEPKEAYTTGYHSNPQLLLEAYQIYDNNFALFGDNWFSPKNVLCAQKIVGLSQRGLSACELQLHAQGLFSVLRQGSKSKRTFSFTYGVGSILPFDSDLCFRLGYNYMAGADGEASRADYAVALEILCRAKTSAQQRLCHGLSSNRIGAR